jgi:formylglycine-generating enzyme required for sulfatase activity
VHACVGLYETRTRAWTRCGGRHHLFSWRYAQFLVSDRMLNDMRREKEVHEKLKASERGASQEPLPLEKDNVASRPQERDPLVLSLGDGVVMEFAWIPPGRFPMGSPANELGRFPDERLHPVSIPCGFWMGKHEVTQRQWSRLANANPSRFVGEENPVENVTWDDCRRFVREMNRKFANLDDGGRFALPTEEQWEYACRAGTTTRFHSGDGRQDLQTVAWFACDGNSTHPVGRKRPNAWGLFDMHGNVWEWCRDVYTHPSRRTLSPPGWSRVLRGGSWDDYEANCRSANRIAIAPGYARHDMGFRLVREAPSNAAVSNALSSPSSSSIRALREQHHPHGPQQDLHVQHPCLVPQIVHVQNAHLLKPQIAPTRNLP